MKVNQHFQFSPGYPESFNWGMISSPKLERVAWHLVAKCKEETSLDAGDRHLLGGLRFALNIIADIAEI